MTFYQVSEMVDLNIETIFLCEWLWCFRVMMFLFIISTNKEYAEWPAPRQNNKKRENAAGHVTDLQPSFNNTPTQAIMHVYQIMKTIIIYEKNIQYPNLPIMSIVAASTPVAAVATTTTATAIVSRPVTTAAAIVPYVNLLIRCILFTFVIIISISSL